jgi:L-ascorbate metabolism protein UlaG (beta-lactamase superfamily)
MLLKFLGHACFYFEWKNKKFIVDPFITPNSLASEIVPDEIEVDYILITHGHEDHVADVIKIAGNNPDALLISNFEIISWFGEKGLNGHPMNHGGKHNFDFGTLKYVNAIHSSVLPDGSYGGNPGGFVLWDDEKSFYIAGDTALTHDMKLIPMLCPSLDFAILPIGDNFTMGYEEAILASDFIQCQRIIGCHFDTFPPIKIDHLEVKAAFAQKKIEFHLPEIGETIEL